MIVPSPSTNNKPDILSATVDRIFSEKYTIWRFFQGYIVTRKMTTEIIVLNFLGIQTREITKIFVLK